MAKAQFPITPRAGKYGGVVWTNNVNGMNVRAKGVPIQPKFLAGNLYLALWPLLPQLWATLGPIFKAAWVTANGGDLGRAYQAWLFVQTASLRNGFGIWPYPFELPTWAFDTLYFIQFYGNSYTNLHPPPATQPFESLYVALQFVDDVNPFWEFGIWIIGPGAGPTLGGFDGGVIEQVPGTDAPTDNWMWLGNGQMDPNDTIGGILDITALWVNRFGRLPAIGERWYMKVAFLGWRDWPGFPDTFDCESVGWNQMYWNYFPD